MTLAETSDTEPPVALERHLAELVLAAARRLGAPISPTAEPETMLPYALGFLTARAERSSSSNDATEAKLHRRIARNT